MRSSMIQRVLLAVVLLGAVAAPAQVPFVAETTAIPTATAGDLAIVPAPEPLIAAADPLQNGLYVYATDGGLRQVVPYGALRGVDCRTGLAFATAPSSIVAAGAAVTQSVVFGAPGDGGLTDVTSGTTAVPTVAALALYRPPDGGLEVIADDSAGTLRRLTVEDDLSGALRGVAAGTIALPGVPSGLVVDDRTATLYAAVPSLGVFRVDLAQGQVNSLVPMDGGGFGSLVGGLTFYPLFDGGGLLLTTVPASDEVTVHELAGPNQAVYVTRFRVEVGARVVRAPQHVDVVANRLDGFDAGLFVIHDTSAANYKLVPWELLAQNTPVPLPVNVPEDFVVADAGASDAGTADGGAADGGIIDGGSGGGTGGGSSGTGAGPPARPLEPTGCGCTGVSTALFPALWGLWILNRSRRRRTGEP